MESGAPMWSTRVVCQVNTRSDHREGEQSNMEAQGGTRTFSRRLRVSVVMFRRRCEALGGIAGEGFTASTPSIYRPMRFGREVVVSGFKKCIARDEQDGCPVSQCRHVNGWSCQDVFYRMRGLQEALATHWPTRQCPPMSQKRNPILMCAWRMGGRGIWLKSEAGP